MKKYLLLLFILLCSCDSQKSFACVKYSDDNQIYLDINANNDDIDTIKVKEVFILPYEVLNKQINKNYLNIQLDNSYYSIDNKIIKEYDLSLDKIYSLNKTLQYLKKEHFICE